MGTRDRALGALIGLAVGDAVGATVTFMPRGHFAPLTDMVGGGPFCLEPGQWTDNTAMALCLAESLLACPRLDAEDVTRRFRARINDARPVWGADTACAVVDPMTWLAPLALRWWRDPAHAAAMAMQQGRLGQGADDAAFGCVLLAHSLCRLIAGDGRAALLADAPDWPATIRSIGQGNYRGRQEAEIQSAGSAADLLEAAYWVLDRSETFEQAVLAAANLGEDATTVAAVTGQLAGAMFGYSAIPARWARRLAEHELLLGLAIALFATGEEEA